jgi:FkbM family methyltransferase
MTLEEAFPLLQSLRHEIKQHPFDGQFYFLDFCLRHLSRSKSEIFQDLFVLYELKEKKRGYFVEFGAGNGVDGSNTCMLERQYEWNGILAEPAKILHGELGKNRTSNIDIRCVWSRSGEELLFNQPPSPGLSTLDQFSKSDKWAEQRSGGEKYLVETVSLNDLLSQHQAPNCIDYMSIDTEGSEFEILSHFNFEKYDVRVITVEHNHTDSKNKIYSLLSSKGYVRKFESLSQFEDWYVKTYQP